MMKSWQKYSVLGALLVGVAGLGGLGTYALMQDHDASAQAFANADLRTELTNTFKFDPHISLTASKQDVSGQVTVKNTGTQDQFVRVMAFNEMSVPGEENLPILVPSQTAAGTVFEWTIGDKWTDGGDGYYYYNEALAPGKESEPVITKATFGPYSTLKELLGWSDSDSHQVDMKVTFKAEAASRTNDDLLHAFWQGSEPSTGPGKTIYQNYMKLVK